MTAAHVDYEHERNREKFRMMLYPQACSGKKREHKKQRREYTGLREVTTPIAAATSTAANQ